MSISTRYNPQETEAKWYQYWMDGGGGGSLEEFLLIDEGANFVIDEALNNVTGIGVA